LLSLSNQRLFISEINPKRKITNIVPFQLNISVIIPPKAKLKNGTIIIILLTIARILAASRLLYESLIIGIKMVPAAAAPIPCNTLAKTNNSKDSEQVLPMPSNNFDNQELVYSPDNSNNEPDSTPITQLSPTL